MEELKKALKEAESIEEDFPGQKDDFRRQLIVRHVITTIHDLIDCGAKSNEEEEYLLSVVLKTLVESGHGRIASRLLTHDLKRRT